MYEGENKKKRDEIRTLLAFVLSSLICSETNLSWAPGPSPKQTMNWIKTEQKTLRDAIFISNSEKEEITIYLQSGEVADLFFFFNLNSSHISGQKKDPPFTPKHFLYIYIFSRPTKRLTNWHCLTVAFLLQRINCHHVCLCRTLLWCKLVFSARSSHCGETEKIALFSFIALIFIYLFLSEMSKILENELFIENIKFFQD